jgi:hypothetical protein
MRSPDALRGRWLELIRAIMSRTGMHATTGREMEVLCSRLLDDLCYLDDLDAERSRETRRLHSYGKLGVVAAGQRSRPLASH